MHKNERLSSTPLSCYKRQGDGRVTDTCKRRKVHTVFSLCSALALTENRKQKHAINTERGSVRRFDSAPKDHGCAVETIAGWKFSILHEY